MEQDTPLLEGLRGPLLQCPLAEEVADMVRGELASARSLSARADIHQLGGYDCERPGLAVADVEDLRYVEELGEHGLSRSQAGWSKPEDLGQPPLLILEGYTLHVAPRGLYIDAHVLICIIIFLLFSKSGTSAWRCGLRWRCPP